MINPAFILRLLILIAIVSVASCKNDSGTASLFGDSTREIATSVLNQVVINGYVVVSTRRVGRTVTEYTLKAVASNTSSNRYTNVTATLTSVPSHITIVDNVVVFGTLIGNANTTSADEFIIEVDLSVNTSLNDLVWRVDGTVPSSGGGGSSPQSVGIFMNIDGGAIQGESKIGSHEDWIELLSFTEGSSIDATTHTGSGGGTGKVNLEGVTVTKFMDRSSPQLRLALAEGDLFTEVKIDIIRSCGGSIYTEYGITLTVSILTTLGMSTRGGEDRPTESLSFNYSRIETMYTPVNDDCSPGTPIYSFQDATGTTK